MSEKIYKIVSRREWLEATESGVYAGSEVDAQDGFIHFSAAHQVQETANKHFAGQEDLLLVAVEDDRLGEALKWERSRGGDLFPHLYATLMVNSVSWVRDLVLMADGVHQLPDLN